MYEFLVHHVHAVCWHIQRVLRAKSITPQFVDESTHKHFVVVVVVDVALSSARTQSDRRLQEDAVIITLDTLCQLVSVDHITFRQYISLTHALAIRLPEKAKVLI